MSSWKYKTNYEEEFDDLKSTQLGLCTLGKGTGQKPVSTAGITEVQLGSFMIRPTLGVKSTTIFSFYNDKSEGDLYTTENIIFVIPTYFQSLSSEFY